MCVVSELMEVVEFEESSVVKCSYNPLEGRFKQLQGNNVVSGLTFYLLASLSCNTINNVTVTLLIMSL